MESNHKDGPAGHKNTCSVRCVLCIYNVHVHVHVASCISVSIQVENEENVLVCLKVIIELHKQFRPSYSPEVIIIIMIVYIHVHVHDCIYRLPSSCSLLKSSILIFPKLW